MRLLSTAALCGYACSIVLALIGVIKFPHAPIMKSEAGFIDEKQNSHTAQDYQNFKIWEISLAAAGLLCLGSTAGYYIARKRLGP